MGTCAKRFRPCKRSGRGVWRRFLKMRPVAFVAAVAAALTLTSCSSTYSSNTATRAEPLDITARWDHKPQSEVWTGAVLDALDRHGAPLVSVVPADIDTWCPAYADGSREERKAFWVGLLSALAKHESTWRPDAAGGGGRWIGLVQIAPGTARSYGCVADSTAELKNGAANLSCAVRIMASTVLRDGVVSEGMRGVAADWGPFHQARKREDMREWVRSQGYCQG